MAPTLATSCAALPPEGANFPRGGPSGNVAPTLATSCAALDVLVPEALALRAVPMCAGTSRWNSSRMHSAPVRPVVRRMRSSTSMLTAWRRQNSTQLFAWYGMESIMVPSMSKIKAPTFPTACGSLDVLVPEALALRAVPMCAGTSGAAALSPEGANLATPLFENPRGGPSGNCTAWAGVAVAGIFKSGQQRAGLLLRRLEAIVCLP